MGIVRGVWYITKLTLISAILAGIILSIAGGIGAAVLLQNLANDLPPLSALQHKPSITTKIYDVNGVVLDELFSEELREKIVPLSTIPKLTQAAFIATEDQRFYHHYGIDPKRILGALYADFVAKQAVQGASTITQQLAKNVFLSREKSIKRKLKEVIMAVRLERTYTKDEILALYLNEIFFGDRIHGIASASKYYFGKDVKDLDLAESAILAGLPKAPNLYSPFNKRRNAWKDRQKTVLMLMEQQGYISRTEMEAAQKQEIKFATGMDGSISREAPYFLEFIKRQLLDKFGFKRVYAKGLKVYTTLDIKVQKLAEQHFLSAPVFRNKAVEDYADFGGSFLAIDPTDGSIRAMIGGRDFTRNKYNRAVQARRQPGSSFKPFVYAAAFAAGISPSKTMMDEPWSKWDAGSQKWWSPGNYGNKYSYEYVTLAYALAKSLNVVAVKTCEMVGVEKVIAMAQRLGINSPLVPNLTLALGSSEVTLLEMVSAYGSFANQGIHVNPRGIIRVEDADGQTIYEEEIVEREVLDEKVAYTMVRAMMGVVEFGTGTKAKVPGYQLAGKTGTTQDFIDAWFVGYMPDLAVGMNVGFEGERKSMGKGMTGGTLIAPVVGQFLREYVKMYQVRKEFRAPSGMNVVAICRESSLLPGQHCTEITSMAFPKGKEPSVHCHSHGVETDDGAEEETVETTSDAPPAPDPMAPVTRPPPPAAGDDGF